MPWRVTYLTWFGMSCKKTIRTAPPTLTNPTAWSAADRRLSNWEVRSKIFKGRVIRNLEGKIKKNREIMAGVSPMILALALANLSLTKLTSGGIGLQSWPKPIPLEKGSWLDVGRSDRWRHVDRHYWSVASSNEEARGELVPKMTPKAGRSQPSDPKRWEYPKMHPLGDEGIGMMMQIRWGLLQHTSCCSSWPQTYRRIGNILKMEKDWDDAGCFLIHNRSPYIAQESEKIDFNGGVELE